jgi:predicted nucleic acid-binding protein
MSADDIFFLDTNILVYAEDSPGSLKKSRSEDLILGGMDRGTARISAQVARRSCASTCGAVFHHAGAAN